MKNNKTPKFLAKPVRIHSAKSYIIAFSSSAGCFAYSNSKFASSSMEFNLSFVNAFLKGKG